MNDLLKKWRVMKPKVVRRVAWDSDEKPEIEWIVDENYPPFEVYETALRTVMGDFDSALRTAPLPFLRLHAQTPLYQSLFRIQREA